MHTSIKFGYIDELNDRPSNTTSFSALNWINFDRRDDIITYAVNYVDGSPLDSPTMTLGVQSRNRTISFEDVFKS